MHEVLECSPMARETGDSIPGRVIPKTQKIGLDATLFNLQHYKVGIKGKVEEARESGSALPYTSVLQLMKRKRLGWPRLRSPTLLYNFKSKHYCVGIFDLISLFEWHIKFHGLFNTKAVLWLYTYTYICVCVCVCARARTRACVHVRVFAYIHLYRRMCIYFCIYKCRLKSSKINPKRKGLVEHFCCGNKLPILIKEKD